MGEKKEEKWGGVWCEGRERRRGEEVSGERGGEGREGKWMDGVGERGGGERERERERERESEGERERASGHRSH